MVCLLCATALAEKEPAERIPLDKALVPVSLLLGPWNVVETHFDRMGAVVATVKGTEENVWILDERAIQRTYTTSHGTQVYRAVGTLTWNERKQAYEGTWYNNMSTAGPTIVSGTWDGSKRTFVFDLQRHDESGKTQRYRVVDRFVDEDNRQALTYLMEDGKVIKQVEVNYARFRPCPPAMRVIYDGVDTGEK